MCPIVKLLTVSLGNPLDFILLFNGIAASIINKRILKKIKNKHKDAIKKMAIIGIRA